MRKRARAARVTSVKYGLVLFCVLVLDQTVSAVTNQSIKFKIITKEIPIVLESCGTCPSPTRSAVTSGLLCCVRYRFVAFDCPQVKTACKKSIWARQGTNETDTLWPFPIL